MNRLFKILSGFFCCMMIYSCGNDEPAQVTKLFVDSLFINEIPATNNSSLTGLALKPVEVRIVFSAPVDPNKISTENIYFTGILENKYTYRSGDNDKTLLLSTTLPPQAISGFSFNIREGEYLGGRVVDPFKVNLVSQIDSTPKFPTITDEELLMLIQRQTYKYFYDYAHPVSGLARERLGSGETVTTGGSGFGFLATLTAINRGFITRNQGFELLHKSVTFLNEKADRFHGAFPHWLSGTTGKVEPFSTKDNGGDLVETAFLMQGLLTVKEYFKAGNTQEKAMCDTIQKLWEEVEWDWYRQNGQNRLYWHWSPTYNWDINMPVTGYNEALIVYVLAASSPTRSISKAVYDEGWARNGAIRNGQKYLNINLPLGESYGGPMFFAHYSFLCLDPRNLSDQYAGYWEQNVAHARINQQYCEKNPRGQYGYSALCWGLTASDIKDGYLASSPTNDVGVIAPTAALASMPYVPVESLNAARFYYYTLGDKIWGDYGFKDAFNLRQIWFASSYLAIDQGPIIAMIENYRSALLWNTFMQNSDVKKGLIKLGFSY